MSNSFSAADLGFSASRPSAVTDDTDSLIRAIYNSAREYVAHAADPNHTGGSLAKISNAITRYGRKLEDLGVTGADLGTDRGVLDYPDADAYHAAVIAARDARIAADTDTDADADAPTA